ncbi:MAG: hypothetical protein JWP12_1108 [Bacteroidetes bacterium]|nr:hypothetical protein [Bacteroidota bacterium]
MLKYGVLLFNTIALLIYQFFFADAITVTQNIPSSAKPDTEFIVELTISKGTTGGFAKLQQDLPEGFTAVQDENNGASFTFSNQSVKFIWMSLPGEKEFKIKYKVKVAAGVSGDKIISGKFSYVTDNVKQSVDIAPSTIKIDGGTSTPVAASTSPATTTTASSTPATTTQNTSTDNTLTSQLIEKSAPAPTTEASSITCVRTVPANPSGDFTVEINVNKGNVSGFAKLLETLPAGFTATAIESQGASFSFLDGKVKYVWVSMPASTEFKIRYKVSVAAGTSGSQNIDGVFSYIENDDTKKYVLPTSTVTIGGASQPVATTPVSTTPDNTTKSVATTPDNTTPVATTPVTTPTADKTTTPATTNATDNTAKTLAASTIPAPQGNVNYKVQIAALHNAVDADKLAIRFNINEKVQTEMAEGYTKYLVGAHNDYKSARDSRETIKSKGVSDAFVTAYNSGKRITVQEALMITTQKWYR